LKTKNRFFLKKLEPSLEGKEKFLSQLSVAITVLAGVIYMIVSIYFLKTNNSPKLYRNIGGAFIFGCVVSTLGIGVILQIPPNRRIYWAITLLFLLIYLSFFQMNLWK
jgi:hypothetical protein